MRRDLRAFERVYRQGMQRFTSRNDRREERKEIHGRVIGRRCSPVLSNRVIPNRDTLSFSSPCLQDKHWIRSGNARLRVHTCVLKNDHANRSGITFGTFRFNCSRKPIFVAVSTRRTFPSPPAVFIFPHHFLYSPQFFFFRSRHRDLIYLRRTGENEDQCRLLKKDL